MSVERGVRLVAGLFVMASLALGLEASPIFTSGYFLWLTGFVGFMLFQSALTGFCPMALILKGIGLKSAP
ncbi:MAG TPA: DUF2892 domain-containing protein [Anaeromyxobacteraceae bacterium]|nr:DUF2892 domain-containing protein [Anaeromyxobacteraceae bacterium]